MDNMYNSPVPTRRPSSPPPVIRPPSHIHITEERRTIIIPRRLQFCDDVPTPPRIRRQSTLDRLCN